MGQSTCKREEETSEPVSGTEMEEHVLLSLDPHLLDSPFDFLCRGALGNLLQQMEILHGELLLLLQRSENLRKRKREREKKRERKRESKRKREREKERARERESERERKRESRRKERE